MLRAGIYDDEALIGCTLATERMAMRRKLLRAKVGELLSYFAAFAIRARRKRHASKAFRLLVLCRRRRNTGRYGKALMSALSMRYARNAMPPATLPLLWARLSELRASDAESAFTQRDYLRAFQLTPLLRARYGDGAAR